MQEHIQHDQQEMPQEVEEQIKQEQSIEVRFLDYLRYFFKNSRFKQNIQSYRPAFKI